MRLLDLNRGESMKALIMTVAAAGSLMLAGQASAVDAKAAEALAQKSGCLA